MAAKQIIAAIDVGGTFTDGVLVRGREVLTCKVPSTPHDPGLAVAHALHRLGGADLLIHGTTVATNALLQGRLGRVALVTTKGFRDVLAIGRQNRAPADLYALEPAARSELVPRELRFEVAERIGPDGAVELKLTRAEVARVCRQLAEARVQAVALCLLHSYANPAHEKQLGDALRKAGVPVVLSSELAPEFREYERSLVTAANAALLPVARDYIDGLTGKLGRTRVVLMHSAGGWLPSEIAAVEPVKLALSGPAGGIAGVRAALDADGFDSGIAFDVGGTSTDVALVTREPRLRAVTEIAGLPLRTPSLDIHTIGAGGGSLAFIDAAGALQVGPQSAGAQPGPACYGRGGEHATLTDALMVLGRLPAELKLGGELALLPARAESAVRQLGPLKPTADAIRRVALAGIERALRRVSVERGVAVQNIPLVPFGGAGGLLACDLAELLGTELVLVPRHPGLLCALGMLHTPASRDLSRTLLLSESTHTLQSATRAGKELADRATAELRHCGLRGPFKTELSIDVRYVGQSFELNVPLTRDWKQLFEAAHLREFHFVRPGSPAEVVNVRVRVSARATRPKSAEPIRRDGRPQPWTRSASGEPVFRRDELPVGHELAGPSIVTELSSCLYINRGWKLRVTRSGQLLLKRGAP